MRIVKAWSDQTITDKEHMPGQRSLTVSDKPIIHIEVRREMFSPFAPHWKAEVYEAGREQPIYSTAWKTDPNRARAEAQEFVNNYAVDNCAGQLP
jgi:hypothetical protein